MSLRRRLLVFGYPALELLTLFAVASLVGLGWLLLGLALGVLIGLAIMQTAGRNAFAAMQAASRSGAVPEASVRRHGSIVHPSTCAHQGPRSCAAGPRLATSGMLAGAALMWLH